MFSRTWVGSLFAILACAAATFVALVILNLAGVTNEVQVRAFGAMIGVGGIFYLVSLVDVGSAFNHLTFKHALAEVGAALVGVGGLGATISATTASTNGSVWDALIWIGIIGAIGWGIALGLAKWRKPRNQGSGEGSSQ